MTLCRPPSGRTRRIARVVAPTLRSRIASITVGTAVSCLTRRAPHPPLLSLTTAFLSLCGSATAAAKSSRRGVDVAASDPATNVATASAPRRAAHVTVFQREATLFRAQEDVTAVLPRGRARRRTCRRRSTRHWRMWEAILPLPMVPHSPCARQTTPQGGTATRRPTLSATRISSLERTSPLRLLLVPTRIQI